MPAIWSIASLLPAFALEAYALQQLLTAESGFAFVIAWHALASLAGALGAAWLLPGAYHEPWHRRIALYGGLMFMMPGFGLPGVLLFIIPSLFYPRPRRKAPWREIEAPDLPFRPVQAAARPSYGEGGLLGVLRAARDPERRVRAVIAARQINDKLAIPLLQEALKDPVDDVRLFAYSVIASKENHLNEQIARLLAELEKASGLDAARIHYALAQHYWELAFLGLAAGSTLDYVLDKAASHAASAAECGWAGADVAFLLGRIALRRERYDEAEEHLLAALRHGALESAVLPFLAEIAFVRRRFNEVREILHWLDFVCHGHPPIPAVVRAWRVG